MKVKDMKIGAHYNWKYQPERLIYMGMCEPRNGRWHQFAKADEPEKVWCELSGLDLEKIEPTAHAETAIKMIDAMLMAAAGPVEAPTRLNQEKKDHPMHTTLNKIRKYNPCQDGWKEAAIAWEVCAAIHRKFAKGKDPLFTTRQSDFVKHANVSRKNYTSVQHQPAAQAAPVSRDWFPVDGNTRGYKGDIVLRHYKQKDQYRLGHTNWIGAHEVTPYSPSGTAKPVAAWKGTIEDTGLDTWMPLGDFTAQAAPVDVGDTKRLDWLDRQVKNHAVFNGYRWQEAGYESNRGLVCAIQKGKDKASVREAIDAARAAQGDTP